MIAAGSFLAGHAGHAAAACKLRYSPPISVTRDGQIIEYLRIRSGRGPAITIKGRIDVVIRNVEIEHRNGPGIVFDKAPGLVIENVSITNTSAAKPGAKNPHTENNITGSDSPGVTIRRVRLTGGSSGIYLKRSDRAKLSFIEGYNFRGPFPRGQLVQFHASNDCLLEDFSVVNQAGKSWVEDNVSVFRSSRCTIRRGLVDGNNSPSGVGIMIEHKRGRSSKVVVEDVDAVRQGNGCFSAYPGFEVTFRRTRCRDNICRSQGRGKPLSKGLAWAGRPGSGGLRIEQSSYFALCNPRNLVWARRTFTSVDLRKQDFRPRPPIRNRFCWEHGKSR